MTISQHGLSEFRSFCRKQGKSPRLVRRETRSALPACNYMHPIPFKEMPRTVPLEQDCKGLSPSQRKRARRIALGTCKRIFVDLDLNGAQTSWYANNASVAKTKTKRNKKTTTKKETEQ